MSQRPDDPNPDERLVDQLRSGAPGDVNDAILKLYPLLRECARREMQRRGVRSREADTLVDSVLFRCLGPAAERCADDDQLRAYLAKSIRNAIIDAGRARQPKQFPEDAGSSFGPVATDPRPEPPAEDRLHDHEALSRFVEAVEQSTLGPRERELVQLFVVRGMAWEHVASILELSSGAARTAMSRARSKLLPQLMQPLRAKLREEDWKILEATIIERRRPEDAAADMGLEPQDMLDRFLFAVFPVIDRCFGSHGMVMLRRLMHKPSSRG